VNGAAVHDQSILNVVPLISQNGDDEVLAGRPLLEADGRGCLGPNDGPLRAVEVMAARIGPQPHVGGGHAQALLDHSCPHGIPGAGIVLGIGHEPCGYA